MPSTAKCPRTPRKRAAALAREIWRITAIGWKLFCAALLPLALRELPTALDRLLAYFGRYRKRRRQRAVETWKARLKELAEVSA